MALLMLLFAHSTIMPAGFTSNQQTPPLLRNDTAHLRIILRHAEIAEIETRPDIASHGEMV
jgi:hypothetical protein